MGCRWFDTIDSTMKHVFFFILLSQVIFAQKFITRNGTTAFKASVDTFEPVEAINKSTTAILTHDGEIASQLFISAFAFKVALMQEHFNENYMDSYQYPKATFRGTIEDFSMTDIATPKEYILKGVLTIREIPKNITIPVSIAKDGESFRLKTSFTVAPKDFDIKIPNIVRKKISDQVNITLDYIFDEKK